MRRAFTLIELSIVLVIIGLIIGGVLVGQDLIHQAELKSLMTDIEKFETARRTFKLKYNCIPGDCATASQFGLGTNGNGDGAIMHYSASTFNTEGWQFWNHLANSTLIAGTYTGTGGSGGNRDSVFGINSPRSGISGVGYTIFGISGNYSTWSTGMDPWGLPLPVNSAAYWIGRDDNTTNDLAGGGYLNPQEAMLLDQKSDDGLANSGRWRVRIDSAGDNTVGCATGTAPNYSYATDPTKKCTYSYWWWE